MKNEMIADLKEMYNQLLPEANEKNDVVVKGVLAFIKRYLDVIEREQLSEEELGFCTSIVLSICDKRISDYENSIQELLKDYNSKENLTYKELSEQAGLGSNMSLLTSYHVKVSELHSKSIDKVFDDTKDTDFNMLEEQLNNMSEEQADALLECFDDFYTEFGGRKRDGVLLTKLMGPIPELEKWM